MDLKDLSNFVGNSFDDFSKLTEQRLLDLRLKDPEMRHIIHLYSNAEIDRFYPVCAPLEQKYPSLAGGFDELRKKPNPLDEIDQVAKQVREIKFVKNLMDLTGLIKDNSVNKLSTLLEKIEPMAELFDLYVSTKKPLLYKTAKAIKEMSVKEGASVEEIVTNLSYLDRVSKQVTPTRAEAETNLKMRQGYMKACMELGRTTMTLNHSSFFSSDEKDKVNEVLKEMPTTEALDALIKTEWDYEMNEFDRIYGNITLISIDSKTKPKAKSAKPRVKKTQTRTSKTSKTSKK